MVIIVVVWISVEIGVGFVIVLVSYVCNGNCVDLLIVLFSSISVVYISMLLLLVKCVGVSFIILWKFRVFSLL